MSNLPVSNNFRAGSKNDNYVTKLKIVRQLFNQN